MKQRLEIPQHDYDTAYTIASFVGNGQDKELTVRTYWAKESNTTMVYYEVNNHGNCETFSDFLSAITFYNEQ